MTPAADNSGSAKRPWPFDSYETVKRRTSFVPSRSNVAGDDFEQYNAAERINVPVPAAADSCWASTDRTLYSWNHGNSIFDQSKIFSNQTVEATQSNIQNDHQVIRSPHPANQGPYTLGHDVLIPEDTSFTGQSAETVVQGDWNLQIAAQGFYSSPSSFPTPDAAAAGRQALWISRDGSLGPDTGTWLTTCDADIAPWNTFSADQGWSCLLPAENALQTPLTQVGDVDLEVPPQAVLSVPPPPVQIIEPAESASDDKNKTGIKVCFGTVSCTLAVFDLFGVNAMTLSTDLRH
jgi:hypothetical protein